ATDSPKPATTKNTAAAAQPPTRARRPVRPFLRWLSSTSRVMGGGSLKSGATGRPLGRGGAVERALRSMMPSSSGLGESKLVAAGGNGNDSGVRTRAEVSWSRLKSTESSLRAPTPVKPNDEGGGTVSP